MKSLSQIEMAAVNAEADAAELAEAMKSNPPLTNKVDAILKKGVITPDTPLEGLGGKSAFKYLIDNKERFRSQYPLIQVLKSKTPEAYKFYFDIGYVYFVEDLLKDGVPFPDTFTQSELDKMLVTSANGGRALIVKFLMDKGAKPTPALYEKPNPINYLFVLAGVPYKKEQVPSLIYNTFRLRDFDDSMKAALAKLLKEYDPKYDENNPFNLSKFVNDINSVDALKILVENGIDPNVEDRISGLLPYQYAIITSNYTIIPYYSEILGRSDGQLKTETIERAKKVLINLIKKETKSADSIVHEHYLNVLSFLQSNGRLNFFVDGLTPLMYYTILTPNVRGLSSYLVSDLNLTTADGMTAAHFAWLKGYPNVVLSELCARMGIPDKKIDDDMRNLKWIDAGAVGRNGAYHPIFSFIGHGDEKLREISGSGLASGYPVREKMLPGRILLVAAECGMYSYFQDEAKKAIHLSNSLYMARNRSLFEDLYSADMTKVISSFKRIQDLIGMPLHMYREGDEYPDLTVGFDKEFKSGLYEYPIDTTAFLDGVNMRNYGGDISALSDAIYPTAKSLEVVSNYLTLSLRAMDNTTTTPVQAIIGSSLFTVTMGKLMEVFGEGIYIYPVCRAISSVLAAQQKMEKNMIPIPKNFLKTLTEYKARTNANATVISALSALEEPVGRIRAASRNRQRTYTAPVAPVAPVTGGGSAAAPVAPVAPSGKGGRTTRRRDPIPKKLTGGRRTVRRVRKQRRQTRRRL